MKGDAGVIDFLNRALKNELTAINQYFLHAKMLKNWGLDRMAADERKESIEEMKHADSLIERILFLNGLPNIQGMGHVRIGEDVNEVLQCDLELELQAIPLLQEAVVHCEQVKDFVSRELIATILKAEEEHVETLETRLKLVSQMGLPNYVQSQSGQL